MLILTNCANSELYSKKKYDDQVLSNSEKINGSYTREFTRHGLTYFDKTDDKKIMERKVYSENKLIYKFPINKSTLSKTDLKLLSGNMFLKAGVTDTIQLINDDLPIMNRNVYVKGAAISRTSDSTYLIKAKDSLVSKATFYISVSDNFEEIGGRKSFISDSLQIDIK